MAFWVAEFLWWAGWVSEGCGLVGFMGEGRGKGQAHGADPAAAAVGGAAGG